jgi:glycosyltransferase involved in cell wall biosynthesis
MKKRIMFVIPSLTGGGAEKVLVVLLRKLDRSKFDPLVVVFDERNDYPDEIPQDVRTLSLGSVEKQGVMGHVRLIRALSARIRDEAPSVVCSFMEYANHLSSLAKRVSRKPCLLYFTQHSTMSMSYQPGRLRSRRLVLWIMRHILYPKVDGVICVSSGVRSDYVRNWGLPEEKGLVIHNPVETERIRMMSHEEVDMPWFVDGKPVAIACGRLAKEKNYPLLLRAFTIVAENDPDLRLVVLGEGELREELERLAQQYGIADRVAFLGFVKNPYQFISRSAFLVLSSDWEGFGNVLVEAMACGTPVISTRCPGPEEIITDGENGLLVPVGNDKELALAMRRLLQDEDLADKLSAAGKARSEDYHADSIIREYELAFNRAAGRR